MDFFIPGICCCHKRSIVMSCDCTKVTLYVLNLLIRIFKAKDKYFTQSMYFSTVVFQSTLITTLTQCNQKRNW